MQFATDAPASSDAQLSGPKEPHATPVRNRDVMTTTPLNPWRAAAGDMNSRRGMAMHDTPGGVQSCVSGGVRISESGSEFRGPQLGVFQFGYGISQLGLEVHFGDAPWNSETQLRFTPKLANPSLEQTMKQLRNTIQKLRQTTPKLRPQRRTTPKLKNLAPNRQHARPHPRTQLRNYATQLRNSESQVRTLRTTGP